MNPYPELPPLLDVPAVAAFLGTGTRVVREEVASGRLGSIRIGRLVRIPRHQLLAYLGAANPADPAPQGPMPA